MGIVLIVIVYIVYYIVSIKKYDKNGHYKKSKKDSINDVQLNDYLHLPSEVKVFILKYKVDLTKINIRGLLKLFGLVISLILTISLSLSILIIKENILLQSLGALVITMILYIIFLMCLGKYFRTHGLVKEKEEKKDKKENKEKNKKDNKKGHKKNENKRNRK